MTLNITQASTERFLSRYLQGALYKYVTLQNHRVTMVIIV